MKTYKSLLHGVAGALALFAVCSAAGCSARNASSPTNEEVAQAVREGIEAKDFEIVVRNATTARGNTISLGSGYSLALFGDTVKSYLPYYGVAKTIPYGHQGGLFYEGPIKAYKAVSGRGGVTEISFTVQTAEDVYYYNIDVRPNGYSTIRVRPTAKQAISYDGVMNLFDPTRNE